MELLLVITTVGIVLGQKMLVSQSGLQPSIILLQVPALIGLDRKSPIYKRVSLTISARGCHVSFI